MKDLEEFWNFIKAKTNWPLLKIQLGVFAIIIFFHDRLQFLYDKYIVDIALKNFRSHWGGDIILLIFLGFLLYDFLEKFRKNYQITFNSLLTLAFIILIYYKNKNEYNFENISSIQDYTTISYFEIPLYAFAIYSLIFLLINVINTIWKPKLTIIDTIGFISDQPIKDATQDTLGRAKVAQKIARRIIVTGTESFQKPLNSFAIGINGKWGSGKTSFVNLIEKAIKEESKCYIWIPFNPWDSLDRKDIISNFFKTLQKYLYSYSSLLSDRLRDYSKLLTNLSYHGIEIVLNSSSNEKTISDSLEKINQILEILKKKLIIFIDDMDRLQKEEIREIIKLIRDTGAFNNTIYVVTYDKEYISKAFEDFYQNNSCSYIEKIFQFEYDLPHIDSSLLRTKIATTLKVHFPKIAEDLIKLGSPIYYHTFPYFNQYITTVRDVNRFMNIFATNYEQIESEVVFSDYFNIELIHYKHPEILEIIFNKRRDFFEELGESYVIKIETNSKKSYLLKYFEESQYKDIAPLIENSVGILFNYPLPTTDQEKLNQLFNIATKGPKAISIINSFYKYFSNCTFSDDISEEEFQKILKLDYNDFIDNCKIYINSGARENLFRKLEIESYTQNKNIFIKVIPAIIELSLFETEFEHESKLYSYLKLYDSLKSGSKLFSTQEFENLLMEILNNKQYFDYTLCFAIFMAKRWHNDFKGLSINEEMLLHNNLKILNDKIENDSINRILPIFNQLIGINHIINEKARSLMKSRLLKEDIEVFAEIIIDSEGTEYTLNEQCKNITPTISDLSDFIVEFPQTNKRKILLSFLEEYKKAGNKRIAFDFSELGL